MLHQPVMAAAQGDAVADAGGFLVSPVDAVVDVAACWDGTVSPRAPSTMGMVSAGDFSVDRPAERQ